MKNATAILEDSLALSYKTKQTLSILSSNSSLWHLSKGVKNLCLHNNLHMNVYRSFIHNCHNLEGTKMAFSKWMDK